MTLEYIASGLAHSRIVSTRGNKPEIAEIYKTSMIYNNGANGHKLGLLYNGHTESGFGEKFQIYKPYVNSIHADSGGLQIVTQGLDLTDAMKNAVYANQSKWADIGMCFDEIPIGTATGVSGRNDTKNRWFKNEELEFFARKTGKNMRDQIDKFLEDKSSCKPMLIAQGNCYDTYMKWTEYVLDEVGQDREQYIGGIAMGAAALGTGPREDIFRAFMFNQLPVNLTNKYLHILGVGSVRRLLPYINFINNGYYDCEISYDSTSHTSGLNLGNYFSKAGKMISFNRTYSKTYDMLLEDICDIYPELKSYSVKDFYDVMNSSATVYLDENKGDEDIYTKMQVGFIFKSIHNFTARINEVVTTPKTYLEECSKMDNSGLMYAAMRNLSKVKTLDDWKYWETHCSRFVKSSKVSDTKPASFADFI